MSAGTGFGNPVSAILNLRRRWPQWWTPSDPALADPRPWPSGFDPREGPVYGRNERILAAPPAAAFELLASPARWPSFYPNCPEARMLGGDARLSLGSRFSWTTFGTRQVSEVQLFEPDRAIGWIARGGGAVTFHRWFLEPRGGGTHVLTEEIETGIVPSLFRWIQRPALHAAHELWLVTMDEALGGPPRR